MSQNLLWHGSTWISALQKNTHIIPEAAFHTLSNPWHKKVTNKIFDETRVHKSQSGSENLLGQKELQQSFKLSLFKDKPTLTPWAQGLWHHLKTSA